MAKKKSGSGLGKLLYFVAAALGVVAVVMMFARVAEYEVLKETVGFKGSEVVFGYTNELDVETLKFSFMALLPYLLALVGVVLTLVNTFAKKNNKIFDFVSIVAFVAAGVLFFFMPSFMVFGKNAIISKNIDYKLAFGAIISAIAAIASGAVLLVKSLLKK